MSVLLKLALLTTMMTAIRMMTLMQTTTVVIVMHGSQDSDLGDVSVGTPAAALFRYPSTQRFAPGVLCSVLSPLPSCPCPENTCPRLPTPLHNRTPTPIPIDHLPRQGQISLKELSGIKVRLSQRIWLLCSVTAHHGGGHGGSNRAW
eukprot:3570058-Pleurochrysis_carterae.AAC.1